MGNAAGVEGQEQTETDSGAGHFQTLTRKKVEDIAKINHVSVAEVLLLYERFLILKPNKDGLINRDTFAVEPYIQDPFCIQLWKRLSGESSDQEKISFATFTKTMFWWQQAPLHMKLELLFTWMKDVEGITENTFSKIVGYALPQCSQTEAHQIAKCVIQIMAGSEDVTEVNLKQFLGWFSKVPEEDLKRALDFEILDLGMVSSTPPSTD